MPKSWVDRFVKSHIAPGSQAESGRLHLICILCYALAEETDDIKYAPEIINDFLVSMGCE